MGVRRTIKRFTAAPYRGRALVLIVPPECDYIDLRQKGRRKVFSIDLASVYDLAAKREALRIKAERKAKRGKK